MSDKTDYELGKLVHKHLLTLGIETPMKEDVSLEPYVSARSSVRWHVEQILRELGLDITDDSLKDTPDRVAAMFCDETFRGLDYRNFPKCTRIQNKMHSQNEFVIETGIQVNSVCEHHLVTIDGLATVAYIPKESVLGLSKMNRLVDFFSRRPQVQERLTAQIAESISYIVGSPDVAVFIDAVHYCVKSRGIRDVSSHTATFHGIGRFGDINDPIRREFMERSRG